MHPKNEIRTRRGKKTRFHIRALGVHRLSVHRSGQHLYAQITAPGAATTVVSASTVEKDLLKGLKGTKNVEAAKKVGSTIAERAKGKGITKVAFDRAGFRYHGRVKALADAAREGGLEF